MEHKNFAYSTVSTAPSPATTGTLLVVATGTGIRFPTAPFNAVIWPQGSMPLPSNAEIVTVTEVSTDTLTITREAEVTSARTVIVGDQISAAITAKSLEMTVSIKTGTYTITAADSLIVCNSAASFTINLPAATGSGKKYEIKNINTGEVTIDGNSGDTIDGETTQTLGQWDSISIVDYAANSWLII